MKRPPPRRVATRASYYRAGRVHLGRALALHPDAGPLDGLVLAVEVPPEGTDPKLTPATTRRYLEDHRLIVAVLVRAARRTGTIWDPAPILARIEAALLARRGRPAVARGASKRVKDAAEEEARLTFVRLKAVALRDRAATAAAAALYVLVEPRAGFRPVELCGAVVAGTALLIPNAKRADGQDQWRHLDLRHLPAILIEAIRLLTVLAPARGHLLAFERWRNSVAASVARASLFASGRRLSLYSFRHVAISTWEKAGFSAQEIAAMAGHLSLRTARTHYARGRSGWAIEDLPRLAKHRAPEVGIAPIEVTADVASEEATLLELDTLPESGRADTKGSSHVRSGTPPAAVTAWFDAHKARIDDLQERLARHRKEAGGTTPAPDRSDPASAPRL